MGGTMRSPLTGALFAVELTGDLHALPALLAATAAAHAVTVLLLKRSILTEKIARRGNHLTREYSIDPFELMRVAEIMVSEVEILPARMTVKDAIAFFTGHERRHNGYPVVDAEHHVVGMVERADVLAWVREQAEEGATLFDRLSPDPVVVGHPEEMVITLVDRMVANDVGRAPIINSAGRLVGLVSRKDVFVSGQKYARRSASGASISPSFGVLVEFGIVTEDSVLVERDTPVGGEIGRADFRPLHRLVHRANSRIASSSPASPAGMHSADLRPAGTARDRRRSACLRRRVDGTDFSLLHAFEIVHEFRHPIVKESRDRAFAASFWSS